MDLKSSKNLERTLSILEVIQWWILWVGIVICYIGVCFYLRFRWRRATRLNVWLLEMTWGLLMTLVRLIIGLLFARVATPLLNFLIHNTSLIVGGMMAVTDRVHIAGESFVLALTEVGWVPISKLKKKNFILYKTTQNVSKRTPK